MVPWANVLRANHLHPSIFRRSLATVFRRSLATVLDPVATVFRRSLATVFRRSLIGHL